MDSTSDASKAWAHAQIRNLYSKYCFGLDYGPDEDLLDCFTPDGIFSLSDRGDFKGPDQIKAILGASAATRHRHQIMNVLIDLDGPDRATCKAYFILFAPASGEVASWGHYIDDAVRCDDGEWRWTIKRVMFDWRSDEYANRSNSQNAEDITNR